MNDRTNAGTAQAQDRQVTRDAAKQAQIARIKAEIAANCARNMARFLAA